MKKIICTMIVFGMQTIMAQAMDQGQPEPDNSQATQFKQLTISRVRVIQDPDDTKSDITIYGLSDPAGPNKDYAGYEELNLVSLTKSDPLDAKFNEALSHHLPRILGKYLGPQINQYDMFVSRFSFYPTNESSNPLSFSGQDLKRGLSSDEFDKLTNSYALKTRRHPMEIYSIHVNVKKKQNM